jgi:maltooligosyltrehalose trehalohydrolase
LAQLRRNTPELVDGGFGDTSVEFDDEEQWLQMSRGKIRVVCNFGEDALVTPLEGSLLLSTDSEAAMDEDSLTLPGASAAVVRFN